MRDFEFTSFRVYENLSLRDFEFTRLRVYEVLSLRAFEFTRFRVCGTRCWVAKRTFAVVVERFSRSRASATRKFGTRDYRDEVKLRLNRQGMALQERGAYRCAYLEGDTTAVARICRVHRGGGAATSSMYALALQAPDIKN